MLPSFITIFGLRNAKRVEKLAVPKGSFLEKAWDDGRRPSVGLQKFYSASVSKGHGLGRDLYFIMLSEALHRIRPDLITDIIMDEEPL